MKILGKDISWSKTNGDLCLVTDFIPNALVRNGKIESTDALTSYGSITLECQKVSEKMEYPITHRTDFVHFWEVFKERGIQEGEEILTSHYKYQTILGKAFSPFLPKMYIFIYPKGSFEKFNDKNWWEQTTGEVLARELRPIAERDPFPDNRFLH